MRCHSEFGNDARNQVERKQPLGASPVAVHREGDALQEKREIGVLPALLKLRRHHRGQFFKNFGIVRARLVRGHEHFVVERPDLIIPE